MMTLMVIFGYDGVGDEGDGDLVMMLLMMTLMVMFGYDGVGDDGDGDVWL